MITECSTGNIPPGYKQTEVGVIPEDWQLRPLLSTIRVASGQVDPKVEPYRSMILVAPDHIESNSGRLLKKETAGDQRAISGKYLFSAGDVVYSKIRPYLRKAILADFDGLCSADMYPLKPAVDVSAGFVFAVILGNHFSKYAESVSVRSGMPKINRVELSEYTIALPPTLAEQKVIAEAISDTDALIESLEQLIAKKRQIKQGAMQELLTGKRRLPGFEIKKGYKPTEVGVIPEDWNLDCIENLAHITTGGKNTQDRVDEGQYPFFVRSQKIERINFYSYDGEAVLTAGDGVGTGKVFHYIKGKFDAHQRVYLISEFNPQIDGYFFFLYFSNHFYNRIMQMTAKSSVDSVRREMISRMLVPLPPLHEQNAIATILNDMDSEITVLEEKLAKARQIKQGMMQELLTGKIRLI